MNNRIWTHEDLDVLVYLSNINDELINPVTLQVESDPDEALIHCYCKDAQLTGSFAVVGKLATGYNRVRLIQNDKTYTLAIGSMYFDKAKEGIANEVFNNDNRHKLAIKMSFEDLIGGKSDNPNETHWLYGAVPSSYSITSSEGNTIQSSVNFTGNRYI